MWLVRSSEQQRVQGNETVRNEQGMRSYDRGSSSGHRATGVGDNFCITSWAQHE